VGDEYPSASILGVDLSPIQPQWVPPNVRFMVDDVESPWLHKPDSLDFIHARHTSVSFKNMPHVLSESYRWADSRDIVRCPYADFDTDASSREASLNFKRC
jgi:hypothetical protein